MQNGSLVPGPRVVLGSDHAAIDARTQLGAHLRKAGFEVLDRGPLTHDAVDYPEVAREVGSAILEGSADWGLLLCGTGVGMSIAANKIPGIRAALVSEPYSARLAREHNDANVIVLGARTSGIELMKACVDAFCRTAFTPGDDGRHLRRVHKLERG